MIAAFAQGMHGDVSLGTVAAYAIAFLALTLIAGFIRLGGIARSGRRDRRALAALPSAPTMADEAAVTARMRAQAAGWRFRGDTATLPLPKPPQARPRPAQPRPRVVTRKVIALDAGEDERLLRIAAILLRPCAFCGAGEGELCRPIENYKWYALDRERGVYAHALRISRAVAEGELENVLAQFDGNMPEEIWSAVL
jgi:hypothetical protein